MPAKYEASCVLPLAAHEYFLAKDSPAYTSLLAKMQKLKGITFVELLPCDDPDTDIMHVITEPDLSAYVPKSLNRFITFDPAVHDHVTYVRDKVAGPTYEWSVDEHLPSLGDSFHNQYCMQLLPIDDKQCRLNAKGEVAIQVRMIGSTAEKITSESITKGIESMHLVLARWVEVRNKMMETEEGRAALLEGRPPLNVVPQEALEALARPYTQQHAAPEGHEFEGDVFFDSQELEVLELPEHASPHLVQVLASDAADLYTAVQAEQDEEEPLATPQPGQPAPVGGRRRGSGRTKAKLKATLRRAQDDWNTQFEEWSKFWDSHEQYIAIPGVAFLADRMKNMLKIMDGLGLLGLLGLPAPDGSMARSKTHTRQWFLDRLQELAETEQRNRATFNRAMSAVTESSHCPMLSSRSMAAAPEGSGERGLQRLATGVMTGMGTVAGGVAVTVGGVAVGVTTVTDGVAQLLQPGNKSTNDDA